MDSVPGIDLEFTDQYNPMITSPNCPFGILFYQTPDTMTDVETYKKFVSNVKSRFRASRLYKMYKDYLMNTIGLNRDATMPNITADIATIEMHHNFITLEDICILITEHTLKTTGYVSTFDIVQLLKEEHRNNLIPIVMLSKTSHQVIENDEEVVLPAQMCFGDWVGLFTKYNQGITRNICQKIIRFISVSVKMETSAETKMVYDLLAFGEYVEGWSRYNEYGDHLRIGTIGYTDNSIGIGYQDTQYTS